MEAVGPTEALDLTSLFPEELDRFRGNGENHSDKDHSEWESNGEVSNNNGDKDNMYNNAFEVFDRLFFLIFA